MVKCTKRNIQYIWFHLVAGDEYEATTCTVKTLIVLHIQLSSPNLVYDKGKDVFAYSKTSMFCKLN